LGGKERSHAKCVPHAYCFIPIESLKKKNENKIKVQKKRKCAVFFIEEGCGGTNKEG